MFWSLCRGLYELGFAREVEVVVVAEDLKLSRRRVGAELLRLSLFEILSVVSVELKFVWGQGIRLDLE